MYIYIYIRIHSDFSRSFKKKTSNFDCGLYPKGPAVSLVTCEPWSFGVTRSPDSQQATH